MAYSRKQVRQAWIRRRRRRGEFVPPSPSAPVNTIAPSLMGNPWVNATLTSSTGSWTGYPTPTFQYEFFLAPSTSLQGPGPENQYIVQAAQLGGDIFCRVTATNSEGSANADSNQIGPIVNVPLVPDAFTAPDWSIADAGTGGTANVTINSLPADNGSTITDIEYRINAGSWVSSGGTGNFSITGLTNDVQVSVQLRAINGVGPGAAGDSKNVTPTSGVTYVPSLDFSDGRNSMYECVVT